MLLTFSKDKFVNLINNGIKIHTIRADQKRRWKPGMTIHFWRGNPRNVKASPYQFRKGTCTGVQDIRITREPGGTVAIQVDGRDLDRTEILALANRDGLTPDEFQDWFLPDGVDVFTGRIIHWTDKRY